MDLQSADDALLQTLENRIPEFNGLPKIKELPDRTAGRDTLKTAVCMDGHPAGYAVAYDRDQDGSLYIWLAAVVPEFRGRGMWSALFGRIEAYAREKKYERLTIKTRNRFRTMLSYLARHDWIFTEIIPHPTDPAENEICAYLPL